MKFLPFQQRRTTIDHSFLARDVIKIMLKPPSQQNCRTAMIKVVPVQSKCASIICGSLETLSSQWKEDLNRI